VRSYRLLLLDKSGRVVGNRSVHCLQDREAVATAERELRKCEYVEIWGVVGQSASAPNRPSMSIARLNAKWSKVTAHYVPLFLPSHCHRPARRSFDRGPPWSSPFDRAGPLEQAEQILG
jgi:hypothetical protein